MRIHDCAARGDLDGVRRELEAGVAVDVRDPRTDLTPLAEAAGSPDGTLEVVQLLLARGADPDAACGKRRKRPLLLHAVTSWDTRRLAALLDAGADVAARDGSGYDALTACLFAPNARRDPRLRDTVDFLLRRGAPLGRQSRHGERALTVASHLGRFDVVRLLLDAGEEPGPLRWTALHRAVALGTVQDVERLVGAGEDLEAKDCWDRTPWLLSMETGDVAKARALALAGADRAARGRGERPALLFAVEARHHDLVDWLLAEGADVDQVDDAGRTALMQAAGEGDVALVQRLLAAGADVRRAEEHGHGAMSAATSVEVMRALEAAGGDLAAISDRLRRVLAAVEPRPLEEACTREDFDRGRARRFGASNPERMDVPFWRAMVAARASAWAARRVFVPDEDAREAVWCYQRYGQSFTLLPDGRVVEVGGEHEDFYDPNFCIYNDVVVFDGHGGFEIYGYPKDVFPPTDFHTATLVGEWIYVIGSLGYRGEREHGRAQVLRLSTRDFHIERVETRGDDPGWISRHEATLVAPASIRVAGGKVDLGEDYRDDDRAFVFDAMSQSWTRVR